VPQWIGAPIAGVQEQANQLGLLLDRQPAQPSDTVPVDRVISTDPRPGTAVQRGDTIKVTVSSGKEQVQVPNMIGQTRAEANNTLKAAGLILGPVSQEPSDRTVGEVIRTDPGAGISVDKGSQVNIVLSLGPTPTPIPSPSPTPQPTPQPTATPPPTPCPSFPPVC
jgi:serine/threonine-protein kinase